MSISEICSSHLDIALSTSGNLDLCKLLVSQNDIRHNSDYLCEMIDFVNKGGFFTQTAMNQWVSSKNERPDPPLIGITFFPDGVKLLHDGHNRAIAIKLGGRDFIHRSELFTKEYKYEHYTILEPQNGWFTPFDPKTELRQAEFGNYKSGAKLIYELAPESLSNWVVQNRWRYCFYRDISSVDELVDRVRLRILDSPQRPGPTSCEKKIADQE